LNLSKYICDKIPFERWIGTGATMCLTKIFDNHIDCINCGDSKMAVFKEFYKGKYETWQCDDISLVMVDIISN